MNTVQINGPCLDGGRVVCALAWCSATAEYYDTAIVERTEVGGPYRRVRGRSGYGAT